MVGIARASDTDLQAAFKTDYLPLEENLYSTYGNIWGMLKKVYGKSGKDLTGAIRNSFSGGTGSSSDGTLPLASAPSFLQPNPQWKRVYSTIELDGLLIEQCKKEGSFIGDADYLLTAQMEGFNRYVSGHVLFNDGTGALGSFTGPATGTAAAPVLTMLETGTYAYRKAYFEKNMLVNVGTDSTVFKITAVNHDTPSVTLERISGSYDLTGLAATDFVVYNQGSKDTDPYGLNGIIDNSSHYGVTEEYRYSPTEVAAASAPLEDEMLIEMVEKLAEDTDEYPDVIVMPPLHYRRYLAQQIEMKRVPDKLSRKPRKNAMLSDAVYARVSYNGLAYAGGQGDIMIVQNKFCSSSRVFALNTRHIWVAHVGKKPGFQAQDGKTYLRMNGRDAYSAFLAMYGEIIINPFHVGAITGLPTS